MKKKFNQIIYSKFALMSLFIFNINNIQSMEEQCKECNTGGTSGIHATVNIGYNNLDSSCEDIKDNSNNYIEKIRSVLSNYKPKLSSIDNIIHNSIVYNSNDKMIHNIVKNIEKHPTNHKQQKLEGFSIIKAKEFNQEYEKHLFSIDDSDSIPEKSINEMQSEIDTLVKDTVLDRNYYDDTMYKNKTKKEKIDALSNTMIKYYNNHAEEIFNINNNVQNNNNNCISNKYDASNIYIPFKILQIMYNSIKKYDNNIAYKIINKVYNENRTKVHNYFKEIYNSSEFESEEHKKTRGFLGSYSIDKIPTHKELDELKGNALTKYWKYANRNDYMFPSINVHYTDEYLQESYKKWSDNIQFKLNNIIENNIKNKPIDNILNYYARVANRSPNIYLSNNVIDFIHNKLGINDVIYFIDKFINIKQKYMTEEDLPRDNANFPNIFNEYPNRNLKEYKVNIYHTNCVACIFNSSDQYNNVAGANNIIIDNNKENLYNRLVDANTTFNPQRWNIGKYYKITQDGNKEYKTVFIYYIK